MLRLTVSVNRGQRYIGVCDVGYRKLSVLTGVPIEQVNFKENISTFGRDQRNQPLCTGVRINRP